MTFQVIKVKYCVERNRLGIKTGGKAHADYSDFLFFLRHRYINRYNTGANLSKSENSIKVIL